jgi:hypothetical protein|eukprot:1804258-Prymnesium_polylepis.2
MRQCALERERAREGEHAHLDPIDDYKRLGARERHTSGDGGPPICIGVAEACICWPSRSSEDEAHASITPSHVPVSVRKLIAHATPSRQPRPYRERGGTLGRHTHALGEALLSE